MSRERLAAIKHIGEQVIPVRRKETLVYEPTLQKLIDHENIHMTDEQFVSFLNSIIRSTLLEQEEIPTLDAYNFHLDNTTSLGTYLDNNNISPESFHKHGHEQIKAILGSYRHTII